MQPTVYQQQGTKGEVEEKSSTGERNVRNDGFRIDGFRLKGGVEKYRWVYFLQYNTTGGHYYCTAHNIA